MSRAERLNGREPVKTNRDKIAEVLRPTQGGIVIDYLTLESARKTIEGAANGRRDATPQAELDHAFLVNTVYTNLPKAHQYVPAQGLGHTVVDMDGNSDVVYKREK